MAQKKKKNEVSNAKQDIPSPKVWPNHLITLIAKQLNLMRNITSFGYVTKSWTSTTPKQRTNKSMWPPQLVEIHDEHHDHHRPNVPAPHVLPTLIFNRCRCRLFEDPGRYFKGHFRGQIVITDADMSSFSLWDPKYMSWRFLPPWDRNLVFKTCALTLSPGARDDRYNVMVVTGASSPAFAFYGTHSDIRGWTIEDCNIKEPYAPRRKMQFSSAIGFKGKFYALSRQGSVVVIEEVEDSCFKITGIGANRAMPSKALRQFREYLVESDGEILLVFLVSRKLIDLVEVVEVFRLNIDKLLWVKLERLGDRALFLGDECGMWVEASKVWCKRNCIYFTHQGGVEWFVFDMGSGHISPAFRGRNEIEEIEMWSEAIDEE